MCPSKKNKEPLFPFTYPKFHAGKTYYVDFCAFDPAENKMKRKKYMLDHIKSLRDKKERAAEISEVVLRKLRSGWNPWIDNNDSRSYTIFGDAIDRYLALVNRFIKAKTKKDYTSRINVMREYNNSRLLPINYVYQYDSVFISDFLDWIYLDRESSARTRNNYRVFCHTFATYLMQKKYINCNPVDGIPSLREDEKIRQPLEQSDLQKLSQYLAIENKHYLLACRFEYYTFIRPEELSNITIGDIDIAEQKVYINSTISKNRRSGMIGLNDDIIRLMIALKIFDHPSDSFLFGKNFRPAKQKADSRIFREKWNKIRKYFKFPNSYQFYSLKDSGIRDLANSVGIVIARDQARHSDISTTNKYLQGRNQPVHDETKHFVGHL